MVGSMSVDTILSKVMKEVPKAVAAGVVDMGTGMLLGFKTVDEHPSEVLDLVAAATRDLFQGDSMMEIEKIFKLRRNVTSDDRYVHEFTFSSDHTFHVFERLKASPATVVVVVCRADTNIAMALTKMRQIRAEERI